MMIRIPDRIEAVIADPGSAENIDGFLKELIKNLRELDTKVERLILQFIFLYFGFELITQAAIAEISLGAFKVSDLSLIQKLMPIIIVTTWYEIISMLTIRKFTSTAFDKVMEKTQEKLYKNDLHQLMLPPNSERFIFWITRNNTGLISKILVLIYLGLGLFVFIIGPMAIYFIMFYRLFSLFSITDLGVRFSIVVTLLYVVSGFLVYFRSRQLGGGWLWVL